MSVSRVVALLAMALLAAAPVGQAYAQPVFYFLKDAPGPQDEIPDVPSPIPLPIATPTLDVNPGVLDPYDPKAPNAPSSNTSKERLIAAGQDLVLPVQFVTPEGHAHPDRIKGSIFVGLWTGQSTTYQGNLTATLYEIPAAGDPLALATASLNMDFNQSNAPDPMSFIPQNTTDPQAIVFYEVAQVLPLLYHPPALFVLGPLDVTFGNDSAFAIGFALTQGSSPAPLPTGAYASVQYDGAVTPSFIYVPWYAPDPPKPVATPRPTSSDSGSFGGSPASRTLSGTSVPDEDKDSPGLALPASLLALLVVAAIAARRRTK